MGGHVTGRIFRNVGAARHWMRAANQAGFMSNAIDYLTIIQLPNGEAGIWVEDDNPDQILTMDEIAEIFGEDEPL
jgi:hypothetical protein